MLRKATADDLPALTALRCGAAKANPVDAAGWLQNFAGLENILVLELYCLVSYMMMKIKKK